MKTTLFGSTGTIGSRILAELKTRGHEVKTPKRDVLDADSVEAASRGADALLSAFGPGPAGDVATVVRAARALVTGAKQAGVRRVIVVGGAGSLETGNGPLIEAPGFPEALKPLAQAHRDALEVFKESGLEWTFYAPAALIAPGERTGKYRVGGEDLIVDQKGESRISAEDYAAAFVDELEEPRRVSAVATVGY